MSTRIGSHCEARISGSTNMPTDTKNTAPKRFFTGSTSRIILSASIVSARILPITKAPNAELKPAPVAMTAIRKHSPSEMMTSVSSVISFRVLRRKSGIRKMPTTNQSTRMKPSRRMLISSCPPPAELPSAMVESITIITIASTSSRINTLITSEAKCCWRRPISSNAL